jgi:AcrR family transcriptional regulator
VPPTKLRTAELRARVLDVAVATLVDEGVAGLTTRRVAREADTSVPAVYELFGDKAGLVRAVFFEGFRLLGRRLDESVTPEDPRAALLATVDVLRDFVRRNPVLAEVMFSRPFADFDPGPEELEAGADVRELFVDRVRRCVEAGILAGDPTDVAHVLLALAQGLAAQETAGWLGTSRASRDRRWGLAFRAALAGLAPGLTAATPPRGSPGGARPGPRSPRRSPGRGSTAGR